ncbi:MAG: hypothetical protein ACE1ZE_06810 [Candidatus Binatia bacterium]
MISCVNIHSVLLHNSQMIFEKLSTKDLTPNPYETRMKVNSFYLFSLAGRVATKKMEHLN